MTSLLVIFSFAYPLRGDVAMVDPAAIADGRGDRCGDAYEVCRCGSANESVGGRGAGAEGGGGSASGGGKLNG